MNTQGLRDGVDCPVCRLGGTLHLTSTSEADRVDGHTGVVHDVPVYACDRCGVEILDEPTARTLERFYAAVGSNPSQISVVDFADLGPAAPEDSAW